MGRTQATTYGSRSNRAGNAASLSASAHARWERLLVGACGVIVLSPVVFNPWGYEQFQLPKLFLQFTAVIVALLAMLVTAGFPRHRVLVPLGAFLAVLLSSALLSDAPMIAIMGTGSRRFGVVSWLLLAGAFVVGMSCSSSLRRRKLLRLLLGSSALVAFYSIYQRLGHDIFQLLGNASQRPASSLGSATYLGGYLALAIGLGVAALVGQVFSWRWLAPVVIVDLVAVLITQSRGAWVGSVIAIAFVLAVGSRQFGRGVIIAVASAALVIVVGTGLLVPGLVSRAASLAHPGSGTAGIRLELASMGVRAISDRPILGWGPDESRPALHRQIPSTFESHNFDDRIEDRVHNWFLDIAVWSGLVGLCLFCMFLLRFSRAAFEGRRDWSVVSVAAGLVAFGGHLFFNFSVPDLDIVVWLLAGTLLVPLGRWLKPVPLHVAGLGAFVAGALLLAPLVTSLQADRSLRVGIDNERSGDMPAAQASYELASAQAPESAVYHEVLARFYLRSGDPRSAVVEAESAEVADRSDPYMVELVARALASQALRDNNVEVATRAEAKLRSLIVDSQSDGSLHLELGNALAAQRRYAEAVEEYLVAVRLVPYRPEPLRNVGLIYELQGYRDKAIWYLSLGQMADPADQTTQDALERVRSLP